MEGHWDKIYEEKGQTKNFSWYEESPQESLKEIKNSLQDEENFSIIDIGTGMSMLPDYLLKLYPKSNITLLDISKESLHITQSRLGDEFKKIQMIVSSVVEYDFKEDSFDIWHDRAVFHFLTDTKDQEKYVALCHKALKMGGIAIIMTFSYPDGPTKCSNLTIQQYSPETLEKKFGTGFEMLDSRKFIHKTPSGNEQVFICCRLQKI